MTSPSISGLLFQNLEIEMTGFDRVFMPPAGIIRHCFRDPLVSTLSTQRACLHVALPFLSCCYRALPCIAALES